MLSLAYHHGMAVDMAPNLRRATAHNNPIEGSGWFSRRGCGLGAQLQIPCTVVRPYRLLGHLWQAMLSMAPVFPIPPRLFPHHTNASLPTITAELPQHFLRKIQQHWNKVHKLFYVLDVDRSGKISRDEIKFVCDNIQCDASAKDLDQIMRVFDS